jgi:hypothetical protein
MSRPTPGILLSLLLLTAVDAPATAAGRSVTLGADATIYRAAVGPHRFLFPGGPGSLARHSVIAIDVEAPGQASRRMVVPASLGDDAEGEVALFTAPGGNGLILVWESRSGLISRLLLSAWEPEGGWSQPVEVPSSPFAAKRGMAAVVTRDEVTSDGGILAREVAHLSWCEGDPGRTRCRYAALVRSSEHGFELALDAELDQLFERAPVLGIDRGKVLPTIAQGAGVDRLVVAIPLGSAGALATMELRLAPVELRRLADAVTEALAERLREGAAPGALTGDVRAHIIMMGAETFRPGTLAEIAEEASTTLLRWAAAPEIDPEQLTGEVRAHIIMMGVEALAGPLTRDAGQVIGVITGGGSVSDAELVVGVVARSLRPLPEVGEGSELLLSRSGRHALVHWVEGRFVRYRESTADGWSAERSLTLGESLDLAGARALLAQRASELD